MHIYIESNFTRLCLFIRNEKHNGILGCEGRRTNETNAELTGPKQQICLAFRRQEATTTEDAFWTRLHEIKAGDVE